MCGGWVGIVVDIGAWVNDGIGEDEQILLSFFLLDTGGPTVFECL